VAVRIRRIEYYYVMVKDRPGEAYQLLSQLAAKKIAPCLNVVPMGLIQTQLVLFPENADDLLRMASRPTSSSRAPTTPSSSGRRRPALVDIHARLYRRASTSPPPTP
jgi:hypothetical protein